MKVYLLAGLTSVLLVLVGFFLFEKYCPLAAGKCCVSKGCVKCTCPCTSKNNVLRWVRDPNTGSLYYGWYSESGDVFNCVGVASFNNRMGDTRNINVPVVMWKRVN